jgi:RNA recognition motif-containing protein
MDRDTGRSKGFGFVEMGSDQEAQAAIAALSGKEVEGRQARPILSRGRLRHRSGNAPASPPRLRGRARGGGAKFLVRARIKRGRAFLPARRRGRTRLRWPPRWYPGSGNGLPPAQGRP